MCQRWESEILRHLVTRGFEGRYSHVLNGNVLVSGGPCVLWWSHKIIMGISKKCVWC